jgi:hypothetical protein
MPELCTRESIGSGDTVEAVADRGKYELEDIVSKLCERKQRATYGAVAPLLGVPPQNLMRGRPRSFADSWIVTSGTGKPTGYDREDIDPDCLRQIQSKERNVISDARTLDKWLESA